MNNFFEQISPYIKQLPLPSFKPLKQKIKWLLPYIIVAVVIIVAVFSYVRYNNQAIRDMRSSQVTYNGQQYEYCYGWELYKEQGQEVDVILHRGEKDLEQKAELFTAANNSFIKLYYKDKAYIYNSAALPKWETQGKIQISNEGNYVDLPQEVVSKIRDLVSKGVENSITSVSKDQKFKYIAEIRTNFDDELYHNFGWIIQSQKGNYYILLNSLENNTSAYVFLEFEAIRLDFNPMEQL